VTKVRNIVKFALAFVLVASLFLNVLFGLMLVSRRQTEEEDRPKHSFTFVWGPDKQTIVNGSELRLVMDFKWVNYPNWGKTLSIVAKINDDDFDAFHDDILGLVFDRNDNGVLDPGGWDYPFFLLTSNETVMKAYLVWGEPGYGGLPSGIVIPDPAFNWGYEDSPFHTCTFDNATGYTFNINIIAHRVNLDKHIVLVSFQDYGSGDHVFVIFDFEEWFIH